MISPVELRRVFAEWRLRLQRAKDILQPPTWTENEWRQFSQALALMVRDHGRSWIIDPNVYWDLRWKLQDGAELICQLEHIPGQKTSLVVAQNGGFAAEVGSYTWLWAEFNMDGHFARDPYWVEGTWKDALTTLLMPLERQASFLLAGRAQTPDSLLLQEGARPNDHNHMALMQGVPETEEISTPEKTPIEIILEANSTPEFAPPVTQVEEPRPVEIAAEPAPAPPAFSVPEQKNEATPPPRIDTPEPFAIRWGMPQKLTWKDTDEIAYALIDTHPGQDPLKLSLTKLHKLIIELPDFGDDPEKSNEAILEAILMAWYEEVK
jgi:FeS assembly protein IscX